MDFANIRTLTIDDLPEYAEVIRRSFATVAEDFGWTRQTAPTFTAYITDERLADKLADGYYPFGVCVGGKIVGFVSLTDKGGGAYTLNQLSVLPDRRHCGYGRRLLDFCKDKALELGGDRICLDIVEENSRLKAWYIANGFAHMGTEKLLNRPFTCGYLEWRATE